MPKKLNISSVQRNDWLNRSEQGEAQDAIAAKEKVNPRTVRTQIERARIERSFEAAQQEQLGEAYRKHQDDMIGHIKRIRIGINIPPLDIDFRFGEPADSVDWTITLPTELEEGHAVIVTISGGQPIEIHQAEEESRLQRALRQHLGNKNLVWRYIAEWQRTLLKEIQSRFALSQVIKRNIEGKSSLSVLAQSSGQQPRLTSAIIRLTQSELLKRSLGEPPSDLPERLEVSGGSLNDPRTALYLTEYVTEPAKIKEALAETIRELADSTRVKDMAQIHQELQAQTKKTRDELEDYELLHFIPGRCDLCKKLGRQ